MNSRFRWQITRSAGSRKFSADVRALPVDSGDIAVVGGPPHRRDVVVLLTGSERVRRGLLAWAGKYAGRTGSVHVVWDAAALRAMVTFTALIGTVASVAPADDFHSTETADFKMAATALAPYGACWTWQYAPWGAKALAIRLARETGAIAVTCRRWPFRPILSTQ
jgi:hypothetical protein